MHGNQIALIREGKVIVLRIFGGKDKGDFVMLQEPSMYGDTNERALYLHFVILCK